MPIFTVAQRDKTGTWHLRWESQDCAPFLYREDAELFTWALTGTTLGALKQKRKAAIEEATIHFPLHFSKRQVKALVKGPNPSPSLEASPIPFSNHLGGMTFNTLLPRIHRLAKNGILTDTIADRITTFLERMQATPPTQVWQPNGCLPNSGHALLAMHATIATLQTTPTALRLDITQG